MNEEDTSYMEYDTPLDYDDQQDYEETSQHFQAYDYDEGDDPSYSEPSFSYKKDSRKEYRSTVKSTDKAFNTVKRIIQGEMVPVSYYRTGFTPGTSIRDAITGIYDTSCRVGKTDEYLYFKVCMATGEGDRGKYGEVEPHHLYYDSPESYERHFGTTLDADVKTNWAERAREERTYRQSCVEESERRMVVQIK
jgi:hypothetical protein